MNVGSSIDAGRLLEEQLAPASPDLFRELLTRFVNTLMSAEAGAVCGAAYGVVSPERANRRNGYRARDFDTRAGTIDLAIRKLREGSRISCIRNITPAPAPSRIAARRQRFTITPLDRLEPPMLNRIGGLT